MVDYGLVSLLLLIASKRVTALVTSTATPPPVTITGLVPRTTYAFSVTAYTITRPGTPQVQTSTADIPLVTSTATPPPVTITGLVPRTTYAFSVTAYTITGPGTPQVQISTADIPLVTSTSITVMWSQPGGEIGTTYTPIATPPVTITGLVPRTTYTSVTAYTITGPGTPQVQTSTADIPQDNSTSIRDAGAIVGGAVGGVVGGATLIIIVAMAIIIVTRRHSKPAGKRTIAMRECAAYREVGHRGHESDDVKMVMQQCDAYGQVGQNGEGIDKETTYELAYTLYI
eukprot:Em0007g264a